MNSPCERSTTRTRRTTQVHVHTVRTVRTQNACACALGRQSVRMVRTSEVSQSHMNHRYATETGFATDLQHEKPEASTDARSVRSVSTYDPLQDSKDKTNAATGQAQRMHPLCPHRNHRHRIHARVDRGNLTPV